MDTCDFISSVCTDHVFAGRPCGTARHLRAPQADATLNFATYLSAACERIEPEDRVINQPNADIWPAPERNIEPASRQPSTLEGVAEEKRADRGCLRGLEDDRIAGSDRRTNFMGNGVQRRVERSDRANGPDWDAKSETEPMFLTPGTG
jgi:hypothetical protein